MSSVNDSFGGANSNRTNDHVSTSRGNDNKSGGNDNNRNGNKVIHERAMTVEEKLRCLAVSTKLRSIMPKPASHPRYVQNEYTACFPVLKDVYTDMHLHNLFLRVLNNKGHRTTGIHYYGSQPQSFVDPTISPHDRDICHKMETNYPHLCANTREEILIDFIVQLLDDYVIRASYFPPLSKENGMLKELLFEHWQHKSKIQKVIEEEAKKTGRNQKKKDYSSLQQLIIDVYFYQRVLFKDSNNPKKILGGLIGLNDLDMRLEFSMGSRASNISIVDSLQADIFTHMFRAIHHGSPYDIKEVCNALHQRKFIIPKDSDLKDWIYPLARKSLSFEVFDKNVKAALEDFSKSFPLINGEIDLKSKSLFAERVRYPTDNLIGRRLYYLKFFSFLQHEKEDQIRAHYTKHIAAVWLQSLEKEQSRDFEESLFRAFAKLIYQFPEDTKTFLDSIFGLFLSWVGEKKSGISLTLAPQNIHEAHWRFSFTGAEKVHHYVLEKSRSLSSSRRQFLRCLEKINTLGNNQELKIIYDTLQAIDDTMMRRVIAQTELKKCGSEASGLNIGALSDTFNWLSNQIENPSTTIAELEKITGLLDSCLKEGSAKSLSEKYHWKNLFSQGIILFCQSCEKSLPQKSLPKMMTFCQLIKKLGIDIRAGELFTKWRTEVSSIFKSSQAEPPFYPIVKSIATTLIDGESDAKLKDTITTKFQVLKQLGVTLSDPIEKDIVEFCDSPFVDRQQTISQFLNVVAQIDMKLAEYCVRHFKKAGIEIEGHIYSLLHEIFENEDAKTIAEMLSFYKPFETTSQDPILMAKKIQLLQSLLKRDYISNSKQLGQYLSAVIVWLDSQPINDEESLGYLLGDIVLQMTSVIAKRDDSAQYHLVCKMLSSIRSQRHCEYARIRIKDTSARFNSGIYSIVEKFYKVQPQLALALYCDAAALQIGLQQDTLASHANMLISLINLSLSTEHPILWHKNAEWIIEYSKLVPSCSSLEKPIKKLSQKLLSIDEKQAMELGVANAAFIMKSQDLDNILAQQKHLSALWRKMSALLVESGQKNHTERQRKFTLLAEAMVKKAETASSREKLDSELFHKLELFSKKSIGNRHELIHEFLMLSLQYDKDLSRAFFDMLTREQKVSWRNLLKYCRFLVENNEVEFAENIFTHKRLDVYSNIDMETALEDLEDIFLMMKNFVGIWELAERALHICRNVKADNGAVKEWNEILQKILTHMALYASCDTLSEVEMFRQTAKNKCLINAETDSKIIILIVEKYISYWPLAKEEEKAKLSQDIDSNITAISTPHAPSIEKLIKTCCNMIDKCLSETGELDQVFASALFKQLIASNIITKATWTPQVEATSQSWTRNLTERPYFMDMEMRRKVLEKIDKEGVIELFSVSPSIHYELFNTLCQGADLDFLQHLYKLFPMYAPEDYSILENLKLLKELADRILPDFIKGEAPLAHRAGVILSGELFDLVAKIDKLEANHRDIFIQKTVMPLLVGCVLYPFFLKQCAMEIEPTVKNKLYVDSSVAELLKKQANDPSFEKESQEISKAIGFGSKMLNEVYTLSKASFRKDIEQINPSILLEKYNRDFLRIGLDILERITKGLTKFSAFSPLLEIYSAYGQCIILDAMVNPFSDAAYSPLDQYSKIILMATTALENNQENLERFTTEVILPYISRVNSIPSLAISCSLMSLNNNEEAKAEIKFLTDTERCLSVKFPLANCKRVSARRKELKAHILSQIKEHYEGAGLLKAVTRLGSLPTLLPYLSLPHSAFKKIFLESELFHLQQCGRRSNFFACVQNVVCNTTSIETYKAVVDAIKEMLLNQRNQIFIFNNNPNSVELFSLCQQTLIKSNHEPFTSSAFEFVMTDLLPFLRNYALQLTLFPPMLLDYEAKLRNDGAMDEQSINYTATSSSKWLTMSHLNTYEDFIKKLGAQKESKSEENSHLKSLSSFYDGLSELREITSSFNALNNNLNVKKPITLTAYNESKVTAAFLLFIKDMHLYQGFIEEIFNEDHLTSAMEEGRKVYSLLNFIKNTSMCKKFTHSPLLCIQRLGQIIANSQKALKIALNKKKAGSE